MAVYALTIFLSAFLLFQVQPVIAKYILPWFGGTPGVWSTCMLFFQVLLLGGYAYSHWLSTSFNVNRQTRIHPILLGASVAFLALPAMFWTTPITPPVSWRASESALPIANILLILAVSVGLPFFILSTTGPLVQKWFSIQYSGRSPYRLYSLSNAGSLAALLSYPFLIEPAIALKTQAWIWSGLYVLYTVLCLGIAMSLRKTSTDVVKTHNNSISEQQSDFTYFRNIETYRPKKIDYTLWILLAMGASLMLLAVTNQMCQEVAVIPFLWILPLSIYLLTFIISFGHERWYPKWFVLPFTGGCFLIFYGLVKGLSFSLPVQIAIFSAGLFIICMACHGELVRIKPPATHLTSYYLCISIGGALGGVFVALIAPAVFNDFYELPIGVVFCLILVFYVMLREQDSWLRRWGGLTALLLIVLSTAVIISRVTAESKVEFPKKTAYMIAVFGITMGLSWWTLEDIGRTLIRRMIKGLYILMIPALAVILTIITWSQIKELNPTLYVSRNFFGVLRVTRSSRGIGEYRVDWNKLIHGRIVHGIQSTSETHRYAPTTYYGKHSGVGLILEYHPKRERGESLRVGAVGLGIGTIAAYAEEGDRFTFYEINPESLRLANGYGCFFSYLKDARGKVDVVLGDGRLSLEKRLKDSSLEPFDVLVLDAFSSDSIPIHLLTREAFETYIPQMDEEGVIAVHISNRYLNLASVVWKIAEHFGMHGVLIESKGRDSLGVYSASWILLARNDSVLQDEAIIYGAELMPEDTGPYSLWTDDYSNLFQCID